MATVIWRYKQQHGRYVTTATGNAWLRSWPLCNHSDPSMDENKIQKILHNIQFLFISFIFISSLQDVDTSNCKAMISMIKATCFLLRRIFHWNLCVVAQKYALWMYCVSLPHKGCYVCVQLTSVLLGIKGWHHGSIVTTQHCSGLRAYMLADVSCTLWTVWMILAFQQAAYIYMLEPARIQQNFNENGIIS